MKKLLFSFCFLVLLFTQSMGQIPPTIVFADLPGIGTTYNFFVDTNSAFTITPGGSSAQTWNYPLITHYTESQAFVSPSGLPGSSNFPSSTLAYHDQVDSNVVYFIKNASGLYADGGWGYYTVNNPLYNVAFDYVPNQLNLPIPFTLNDSRNDHAIATVYTVISGNNIKYVSHVIKTFNADAFGSITTPAGTFSNALRIKEYAITLDTGYVDISGTYYFAESKADTITTYNWVQTGSTNTIILALEMQKNSTTLTHGGRYSSTVTSTPKTTLSEPIEVKTYPNPAQNHINFAFNTNQAQQLRIFDVTGKLVREENIAGLTSAILDITTYEKGLYLCQIQDKYGKMISTQKFVKE